MNEYIAVAVPERVKQYLSMTEYKAANCKFSKDLNHELNYVLAELFRAVGTEVSAIINVRKYFLIHLNPVWQEKMTEINANYWS